MVAFLNLEPCPQVGTLYLMKAGKNSAIGITLDENIVRLAKASCEPSAVISQV